MGQLVADVANRVKILNTLAYGKDSELADYDYIVSFVGIRNDDLNLRFQSLGLNFDTGVVVIPNLPANTTDLSSYQAVGGPLQNLVVPESTDGSSPVEWRVQGGSDLQWEPVPWAGKVIDTNAASAADPVAADTSVVASFEWRGGIIHLSPCSAIVDLRIRGQFLPLAASNDAAAVIKGIIPLLSYWVCALMSKFGPGAGGAMEAKAFQEEATRAELDFVANLAKAQMSSAIRWGGRRTQWPGPVGGPFVPPIVG